MNTSISLLAVAFRIFAINYCIKKARKLNRNVTGWAIFAFLIPLVAIIFINNVSPIYGQRQQHTTNDPIDRI